MKELSDRGARKKIYESQREHSSLYSSSTFERKKDFFLDALSSFSSFPLSF